MSYPEFPYQHLMDTLSVSIAIFVCFSCVFCAVALQNLKNHNFDDFWQEEASVESVSTKCPGIGDGDEDDSPPSYSDVMRGVVLM